MMEPGALPFPSGLQPGPRPDVMHRHSPPAPRRHTYAIFFSKSALRARLTNTPPTSHSVYTLRGELETATCRPRRSGTRRRRSTPRREEYFSGAARGLLVIKVPAFSLDTAKHSQRFKRAPNAATVWVVRLARLKAAAAGCPAVASTRRPLRITWIQLYV